MSRLFNKEMFLYVALVVFSILLSLISIYGHPVFNADGVFYFQVAQAYLHQGFSAAREISNWPFYSIFLAWLSQCSHTSLINSAYLLDVIFSASICLVFVRIVKRLNQRFVFQCFAALLILVWHTFAKQRFVVTRDQGFWLFSLLSLLMFYQYVEKRQIFQVLPWFFSIAIAGFFRIEGMIVLLLAPLSILFLRTGWRQRCIDYVRLNIPTMIIVVLLLFFRHDYLIHNIWSHIDHVKSGFSSNSHEFLDIFSRLLIYLEKFLMAISFSYGALFLFAFLKPHVPFEKIKPLLGYAVPAFLITFAFYYSWHFLESRYLLLLASLFLLFTPFGLYNLWCSTKYRVRVFLMIVVGLLLFAQLVADLYPFGTSHRYLMQAAQWVNKNVPQKTMLYTCKGRLAILAARTSPKQSRGWRMNDIAHKSCSQAVEFPQLTQYNDQALWVIYGVDVRGDHPQIKKKLIKRFGVPLKQFENNHQDALLLFKVGRKGKT